MAYLFFRSASTKCQQTINPPKYILNFVLKYIWIWYKKTVAENLQRLLNHFLKINDPNSRNLIWFFVTIK
jgi:hypothetical protein